MGRWIATGLAVAAFSIVARAEVKTKTVEYKHAGTVLKGYLAWDDDVKGKRPGILVVHEWWGLNDYARRRARQLAKLGYVAFAVDMYGEGKVTEHPRTAGQWASMIRKNTRFWQARALAGLDVLKNFEATDPSRLAAIGYCFGGSTVLQLAYAGADLDAVVSFHGAPVLPQGQEPIKTKILFCHGAADAFIPDAKVDEMRQAWEKAKIDYQMIYYANATHSFTVPEADKRTATLGVRYNPAADRRSWRHMLMLFDEVFKK